MKRGDQGVSSQGSVPDLGCTALRRGRRSRPCVRGMRAWGRAGRGCSEGWCLGCSGLWGWVWPRTGQVNEQDSQDVPDRTRDWPSNRRSRVYLTTARKRGSEVVCFCEGDRCDETDPWPNRNERRSLPAQPTNRSSSSERVVTQGRVVQALGELWAVPHQKLLVGGDGLDRVEVDVHAVLASGQVLLLLRMGRVHVAHPVAFLFIKPVHEMMELSLRNAVSHWQPVAHAGGFSVTPALHCKEGSGDLELRSQKDRPFRSSTQRDRQSNSGVNTHPPERDKENQRERERQTESGREERRVRGAATYLFGVRRVFEEKVPGERGFCPGQLCVFGTPFPGMVFDDVGALLCELGLRPLGHVSVLHVHFHCYVVCGVGCPFCGQHDCAMLRGLGRRERKRGRRGDK
ncbi:hypothetical protein JZ751_015581 [Albula glossodonta]|uniref:Uncharacterized protein n=1 Tax=Albula glossodonta TaxID=121402 RepID=A0A8T2NR74_9TELE|nr:hypothetical protein JZ751_015581 [Albula glossodonta]